MEQITVLDLSGADQRAREFLLKDGDILLVAVGNTFYVLGEVKKPGAYQLDQATTTIQAIAMAGDPHALGRPSGDRRRGPHEVIKRGRKEKDIPLSANDVIVVPESFF